MANLRHCGCLLALTRSSAGNVLCQPLHEAFSVSPRQQSFDETSNKSLSCRFDDIFLGIVALKAQIEPLHSEEFYFYKATYNGPASYRYVLATHGFGDSDEMLRVWSEVRANGYA